jgi:hypothetical protein
MSTLDEKNDDTMEKEKLGFKDLFAIMLAQFSILIPIAIGAVVIMGLLMLLITKVWMRN